MKKFLSLVLALVMTMSLVTISAGAKDFTDGSEINYKEAVDVLSAVKVIDGDTTGAFNPQNGLTRGAAAKIICNMILGPTTAGALVADAAPFKDVPANHTFAGYIAYCSQQGIISGYADGTFRPAAPLTGYAFMKMLLGALGYDKTVEGYDGANWSINVAKRALNIKLNKGLDGDFNGVKNVTREEACLYAFNALNAEIVKYNGGNSVTVNGITFTNGGTLYETGVKFREKYFENLRKSTGLDKAGVPSTTWKLKKDTIGTYGDEAEKTYTATVKEKTVYADIDLTANYTFSTQVNGKTSITLDGTQAIRKNNSTEVVGSGNGIITSFYINSDEDAGYMVQTHPVIGKITSVSKNDDGDRIVYVNGKTFKTDDFAKNDYVIYTTKSDSTTPTTAVIADMELAEKLTGTVTKKVGSNVLYIDGTKYTLSASNGNDNNPVAVDDVVDFYLDDNGFILKIDVAAANINLDNIAFVEKAGSDTGYDTVYKATLRLPDGSKKTVTTDIDYSGAYQGQIVTYKVNSDGDTEMKDNDKFYYYAGATFTKGSPILNGSFGGSHKVATVDTQFVYVITKSGKTEVKLYTGYKNAPSFSAANVALYESNGKTVLAYVYLDDSALTSSASDTTFVIYDKDSRVVDDGDTTLYYEFPAIVNGVITTVKVDEAHWANIEAAKITAFTSLTLRTDGVASAVGTSVGTYVSSSTSGVESVDAETVTIAGRTYTWDDGVKVFFVNSDLEIRTGTVEDIYEGSIGSGNGDSYAAVRYTVDSTKPYAIDAIVLLEK